MIGRNAMQRFGRVLQVREGREADYDRLHAEIWPEMLDVMTRAGICNYSIYRYHRWIFSYFEVPDGADLEKVYRPFAESECAARWEKLMQEIQEPLPESTEDFWWVPMREIFYFKGPA
jgi:L-rhamnose mutarotase